jgi:hypothetical protein
MYESIDLGFRAPTSRKEREAMTKKAKTKPKPKGAQEGGVLFRGADGNLYFINDSALQQYRLPPDQKKKMESGLRKAFAGCIQQAGVSASDTASASDGVLPLP